MFKALSVVLSRTRSRTLDNKVQKQWHIAVNDKQFQRGDIIGEYARFPVEQLLIRLIDVGGLDGALGGLIVAPAGAPGSAHPLLAGAVPPPPDGAAPAHPPEADPPPPATEGGRGGAGGELELPVGGEDGRHAHFEDAVAAGLATLGGPGAPGSPPLDVAAAIGEALAMDTAGDWLADSDGDSDDDTPIQAEDLNAIVERFFES